MSKYFAGGVMVLVLGCGGGRSQTCPVMETVDGFQPVVEGTEVLATLGGPGMFCGHAATVDVELTAPDGTKVPVNRVDIVEVLRSSEGIPLSLRGAAIRFTASQPGVWNLTAKWSTTGETRRDVLVVKRISSGPGVLRRFVDRMDNCERGPFRTNSGTMLCQRNAQIWAYGAGGQLQEYFPGLQLAVRADEVWSWVDGVLEHRTALPASLRLDGSVPLAQIGPEGMTVPGSAIRGDTRRVIEAKWDGTTLSSTTIADGYPIFDQVIVTQGAETWLPQGCQIQRGCSVAECEPVRLCQSGTLDSVLAIDPQRIWSIGRHTSIGDVTVAHLNVTRRPLALGRGPSSFMDVLFEAAQPTELFTRFLMVERARFLSPGFVMLPHQPTPTTMDFVAIADPGAAITVTDEWMVSGGGDPFTLISTQMPSIP